MKRPLILVTGLDHSGTTILDLALGVSQQIVGLGEALYMLDSGTKASATQALVDGDLGNIMCTCKQSAANCEFWSKTQNLFESSSIGATFPKLYDIALKTRPGMTYLLDSSPSSWRYLVQLDDFDLRVIRITRDVRSWAFSHQARRGASVMKSYRRWSTRNKGITRALQERELDVFAIGYEELAMRPEKALRLICDWLGVCYLPEMLQPGPHSGSHIIEGNIASKNDKLAATIRYDGSWMAARQRPLLTGALMLVCARQNAGLVYSNNLIRRKA